MIQPNGISDLHSTDGKPQRGIQALENSGELLAALAASGRPLSLRDLAQAAGIAPAKAFAHLVSLVKTGILCKLADGSFAAGPLSLELGLAALQRLSPAREAGQSIARIAQQTQLSVASAVLGPLGPCVIQLEESERPLHVSLQAGTVMSMVNSAIGRVFAAHLPVAIRQGLLQQDAIRLAGHPAGQSLPADYHSQLEQIARRGIEHALDKPVPGIHTLAAPVFDHTGSICLVIAVMGSAGSFDSSVDGATAAYLRRSCEELSHLMGYFAA